MQTLGIWLAPILAAMIAVVGIPAGLRWRSRRGTAIRRIAERLAWEDSTARGYPDEYDRYLQHYVGGPDWQGTADDVSTATPGTRRTLRRWRGGQAA
jgi:hypothetical protein